MQDSKPEYGCGFAATRRAGAAIKEFAYQIIVYNLQEKPCVVGGHENAALRHFYNAAICAKIPLCLFKILRQSVCVPQNTKTGLFY